MFCRLLNCPFSYFQIKVFKISRILEGVKSQFVNLLLNFKFLNKKERKKKKGKKNEKEKKERKMKRIP